MFIEILRPVILSLLHIHCKICFGSCDLRDKVEILIVRFLRHASANLSMRVLRAFAFNERISNATKKDVDKLMSINSDVLIVPGDNGGILAVKERLVFGKIKLEIN